MYTRKSIDYKLWKISLLLHKLGYYYQIEGRQLLTDISKNVDRRGYSTSGNEDIIILDELEQRANNIFATKPPFDINSGKTHTELAQNFSKTTRKIERTIYVYKNRPL